MIGLFLVLATEIFATARMLGFSLKHAELIYGTTENIGNTYALYDSKHASQFFRNKSSEKEKKESNLPPCLHFLRII